MTDQSRVDWTLSYLERHKNDPKPSARRALQPSLWDALADGDQERLEGAEGGEAIEQPGV